MEEVDKSAAVMAPLEDYDEEELPLSNLSCPICEEPFLDAILQCPEGHAYCRRCWKRWLKDTGRGSCPECRTPVVFSRLVRNRQVERLITELREREKMPRTSSEEIRVRSEKNTEATGSSSPRKSAASSSSSSPPSPASPLSSPRSSSASDLPSFSSSGLYILSEPSHRRTDTPTLRLPTAGELSHTALRYRSRIDPAAVTAAIPQNNFTNHPRAPPPLPPRPWNKRKSIIVRLLRLAILLLVVYRAISLVPLLFQLYFSGSVPGFHTLCGKLETVCTAHWANMSPPPSEHENTHELLREMLLTHSSHLPLLYLMRELYLHMALLFQRILLVSFCITDVILLLGVWFAHRTVWLFYRLAVSAIINLYDVARQLLVDPSGPQLLWSFLTVVRGSLVILARLGLNAARELCNLAANALPVP